ncbi:DivIVA domain-containing protein [Rhodocytophaga rosea]|uniref:DivIVA domain-containing protein n=1 Tax=Rhodocytophaga rosea TaxID=2704465 RepID=A0A6C0GPV2_9BACT|nr:DivIVA domain-containing protein [Rhodocytophaga rosea]QHT70086.1 DivIVA domain-containing protein [Rhodocytophaga rosea]
MKITPIEIRQKSFEKVFRGYDKEEVDAFLQSLSQEWERVVEENKEYRIKLEIAEREVKKLREVENSLYKTLKTAEDTSAHLVEQANRSAEMQMKEAQVKADSLLREARSKAQYMVQEADNKARQALQETIAELKALEKDVRIIEGQKDNLIVELKSIVSDISEKVNRIEARSTRISFDSKVDEVRSFLEQRSEPPRYISTDTDNTRSESDSFHSTSETTNNSHSSGTKSGSGSFFDEIST